MKFYILILTIVMIPYCKVSSQDSIKDIQLVGVLKSGLLNKLNLIQNTEFDRRKQILYRQFQELDTNDYEFGMTVIRNRNFLPEKIQSWSFIECYSWHSLVHLTYVVAENEDEKFYVSIIDHFKDTVDYLGIMDYNYFSYMADLIIPSSEKGIGEDYIFEAKVYKSGNVDCSIAANTTLSELNQLLLIEQLLFKSIAGRMSLD